MKAAAVKSGMNELGSLSVLAALSTIAIPFLAAVAGVIASWPQYIEYITAACQLIGILYVYQRYNSSSTATLAKNIRTLAICMIVSFSSYLFLISQFAIRVPDYKYVIIGYQCKQKAAETYDNCPFLELEQLANAQHKEDDLWTPLSLTIVRLSLTLLWLLVFICLSAFIWHFFALRRRTYEARAVILEHPENFELLNCPQRELFRLAIISSFSDAGKFDIFLQDKLNIAPLTSLVRG